MNPQITRRNQELQNERDELFSGRTETSNHVSLHVDESQFMNNAENDIDNYILQGQAALQNLREQGGMLKNSRKRVLDTAHTLGLSSNVIRYIEKRSNQDKIIFWICVIVCLIVIWAIVHYLKRG